MRTDGWSRRFCPFANVVQVVTQTRNEGWESAHKYIIGALIGAVVFVAGPEIARWVHGGAFAQSQAQPAPGNSGQCSNSGTNYGTMNCGTVSPVAPVPSTPSTRVYDEKLPGFGAGMVVQINDITEDRKKYQYSFRAPDGAEVALYLSPSNHFSFSVTDIHGEEYTLEIPLGDSGVPFEEVACIFCEVGTATSYSYLRALVNGKEVARRDYNFPLDLGSRHWMPILARIPMAKMEELSRLQKWEQFLRP